MTESLLEFVLERLHQVGGPVFRQRELERFPAEELRSLKAAGILRETTRAAEILHTGVGRPGIELIVRETNKGLFGVAEGEDFFDPVPLVEDDVRQYEFVVSKFVDRIRIANRLQGVPVEDMGRLIMVGELSLPGRRRANVYLSLESHDAADFMTLCEVLRSTTNVTALAMLVPGLRPLTYAQTQLLESWGVFVVPLAMTMSIKRWKLQWEKLLKKARPRDKEQKALPKAYCHAITRAGAKAMNKDQYKALIASRDKYTMFVDCIARKASTRNLQGKRRNETLTPREVGILCDYIAQAGVALRPFSTSTGSNCASSEAARRVFEQARKKVDIKLSRYEFKAFRLQKHPSDARMNAFVFQPPKDVSYCLIRST